MSTALTASPSLASVRTAADVSAPASFVVESYYRIRWGSEEEFMALFRKNHVPFLRRQLEKGILLEVRLEAPQDELEAAFAATAKAPIVKGFAVGRTIFVHAAEQWLAGKMSDDEAVADMASRFEQLTEAWLAARGRKAA
jgi:hypothetical protein